MSPHLKILDTWHIPPSNLVNYVQKYNVHNRQHEMFFVLKQNSLTNPYYWLGIKLNKTKGNYVQQKYKHRDMRAVDGT